MDLTNDPDFFALLSSSHQRLVGRPLLPAGANARWAYEEAPFALLAHDTDADPLFVYANRMAQESFGYALDEMIGMPSRLSAEAPDRSERDRLLAAVARDGYVAGYSGVRIAKSGRRFPIVDVTVWQLRDEAGIDHGQAATYRLPEGG
ncbi:MEKHLA domain-containing protein [Methylobacterium brachythecii]|uniref:MEKHLA domain-containing protein n=1 Tax=Methylobacterium brachythecii TaxID=1176177 RepID=A0A7W6F5C7_9HYPH|nr:MEKHLA domain-containing protein [Methylobacterium brachythecii]MBB3901250.1 PAS domain S-box-containing protein [Methylobacterium brachythecii]GLS45626.1 MEKHLA domain-containing protein [Methylobacterium brachythecii]